MDKATRVGNSQELANFRGCEVEVSIPGLFAASLVEETMLLENETYELFAFSFANDFRRYTLELPKGCH